jgi:hypothetical protein
MPKLIEMPDGELVEFPDDMNDAQISSVLRAQTSKPPRVPMSGVSAEEDAAMYERKPKSTAPSLPDYLLNPAAYVGQTAKQLGMSESGANRLGRDTNALMNAVPPLAVETSPLGIMGEQINSVAVKAPKVTSRAKGLFGDSGKIYDQLDSLPMYEDAKPLLKATDDMVAGLEEARMFPDIHTTAYKIAERMRKEFETKGASPGTVEKWRKVIKRDLLNAQSDDVRSSGIVLMDTLDDFINSDAGGATAKAARSTFRKAVQTDRLEFAVRQAERTAARGGKNFTHHLATQLQQLVTKDERAIQKGRPPQFDEKTRKLLDKIASERGGKVLDWIGNLSPDRRIGMMLNMLGLGINATTGGAGLALQGAMALGGYAAKRASEGRSREAVEKLMQELAQ